jgi:hypothetical protein
MVVSAGPYKFHTVQFGIQMFTIKVSNLVEKDSPEKIKRKSKKTRKSISKSLTNTA